MSTPLPTSRLRNFALPLASVFIVSAVAWKLTRQYDRPAAPESAYIRQAPVFELHDQSMKLLRLQRYIGRQKFLVAFFDGSRGINDSPIASAIRDHWGEFQRTGGVVLGVTATRPAANREAVEKVGSLPFVLLSDMNNYEVHRKWGAFDEQAGQAREAIVVVDRAGLIRFVHYGPDDLATVETWVKELRMVR